MNTLVIKEIRQLRPALAAALFLAVVPVWLYPDTWTIDEISPGIDMLFCLGTLFLALTTFGREFGMGTYPLLLALPLSRPRIWWAKTGILACAVAAVFFAGCLSLAVWHSINFTRGSWLEYAIPAYRHFFLHLVLALLVIVASGLWTTLFLRQMLAAFWFAMVVPLALLMLVSWGGENIVVGEVVMGIYAAAGFFLAQRLFYRAQEVAWTGGEVTLPEWRSASTGKTVADRSYHPLVALIGKELQLYKVALMGMAALFVLHLGVVLLRRALLNNDTNPALVMVLSEFGGLWLIVPLITASISVSEERRIGTMEAQLCQPVSQRAQFAVKLIAALLIGGLLCGSLAWTAEYISATLHAGNGFLGGKDLSDIDRWQNTVPVFLIISFIIFFISTLAKNVLQAIAIALAVGSGIMFWPGVNRVEWHGSLEFLNGPLFKLIFWPLLVMVAVRLAYANYRRLTEARRAWLRILRVLAATFLIAVGLTALLFFRTWNYLASLEPAHGPAKITLASAPRLRFSRGVVSAFMPDGWLWSKRLIYEEPKTICPLGTKLPITLGEPRLITAPVNDAETGSNWIAQTGDSYIRVAIRSDGTLWISKEPVHVFGGRDEHLVVNKPAPMVRFGAAANWKDVRWLLENTVALLKNDGTLWTWVIDYSKEKHGFSGGPPVRLGASSDWSYFLETTSGMRVYKNDGSAWGIFRPYTNPKDLTITEPSKYLITRQDAEFARLRSCAGYDWRWLGVRDDGTLWRGGLELGGKDGTEMIMSPAKQVGMETNWVGVAADHEKLVALKSDGTLWKWKVDNSPWSVISSFKDLPERLGTHDDWVAIDGTQSEVCALAADGSVWSWSPAMGNYVWLKPPWKPYKLGNVFSQK